MPKAQVAPDLTMHYELDVLAGDSYHVAATDADRCATATLELIRRCGSP
jgi:hypothetical protein